MFEILKDPSWLRDKGQNVWWSHHGHQSAVYGHNFESLAPVNVKYAPGWSSLLPAAEGGVDAGLQCPMCSTKKAAQM
eukprot:CAMPEP_0173377494 /NCGR_PEP_ID=MMETSP1356-20130122/729_1 /TAXON_ID=77927 ORGANISM="Hemiselmis virescens, Strain PCC157" /NCGR_SAMPLE_ID=MMETSP1356 /ASSEMBLY_ACC=CAM_ASM_000847 /LENGTH=76 /DNA_ID=CAMNT_0014330261 /DNA_START=46 /DNA_END=276 /DNA_ORIENTATION=-